MNKLMGFLELRELSIPTIKWKEFTGKTELSKDKLWTIRSASLSGNDLNLPKMVGKSAEECMKFAKDLKGRYRSLLYVVYYPYFVADKSGTLLVEKDRIVIEATEKDLWNLEKNKDLRLHLAIGENKKYLKGTKDFLSLEELNELYTCARKLYSYFNKSIRYGESILLEWSFARDCDVLGDPVGEQYLVFYEARTATPKGYGFI